MIDDKVNLPAGKYETECVEDALLYIDKIGCVGVYERAITLIKFLKEKKIILVEYGSMSSVKGK